MKKHILFLILVLSFVLSLFIACDVTPDGGDAGDGGDSGDAGDGGDPGQFGEVKLTPAGISSGDRFGQGVALSGDGMTLVAGADGYDNFRGASYVFQFSTSTAEWEEVQQLLASDGSDDTDGDNGDWFGYSNAVSLNGDRIVVGAHYNDSAYLFEWDGSDYQEIHIFTPSSGETGDRYGRDVAISDDGAVIAIGADGYTDPDDSYYNAIGAVYVYHWNDGTSSWDETLLVSSDPVPVEVMGYTLDMSSDGDTVMAGATGEGDLSWPGYEIEQRGAVYVFEYNGTSWSETEVHTSEYDTDDAAYDWFGYDVGVNGIGDMFASGSYMDDKAGEDSGTLYIFDKNGSSWDETTYITASDSESSHGLGYSIDVSDDGGVIAVGADNGGPELPPDDFNAGAVYIYEGGGTSWSETKITASDDDPMAGYGKSVSLSDDGLTLAVGAFRSDGQGAVYVYDLRLDRW
jgi:hypothetical protein